MEEIPFAPELTGMNGKKVKIYTCLDDPTTIATAPVFPLSALEEFKTAFWQQQHFKNFKDI